MKFLKWLLIIVLILVALVLIIPLFLPATVKVSTSQEIAVSPAQVFYHLATYSDRAKWDPWLETEPGAESETVANPDYVGSVYTWNGEKLGTGKEMVDSVVFGKYIAASLWFGESPESSLVEWNFEETENGTLTTWSFASDAKYPVGRLAMNLMKGSLQASFDRGLENLKTYLEANPPVLSKLGAIDKGKIAPMMAIVAGAEGTMEEMGSRMEELYGILWAAMEAQGLQIAGNPFSHYTSWDQTTGISKYLAGIPVASKGRDAGSVKFVSYPEIQVIQAMHTGPYEDLMRSYEKLMEYISINKLAITGEAFEIYLTDPTMEPDITKWQTLIAYPLR
jgi:AraC family transcriptional regulator